jgi:hypothetical protein
MDTLPRAFAGACKIVARPCNLDAKQPRLSAAGAGAIAQSRKARFFAAFRAAKNAPKFFFRKIPHSSFPAPSFFFVCLLDMRGFFVIR